MKLVLLGPPAAGKGTQAKILAEKFSIPTISTGAIIRNAISSKTPLGVAAKDYIDRGELVPDDLVIDLVKHRLSEDDCKNGYILDGFPRTVFQAETADKIGITVDKTVLFDVSDEDVVSRITGRRECPNCGSVYHTVSNPPKTDGICDSCGGKLLHREDDTEETVRKRLDVYHKQTEPLIKFYENKGNLVRVAGQKNIEDTTAKMFEVLDI
jgi:adenylate kinase